MTTHSPRSLLAAAFLLTAAVLTAVPASAADKPPPLTPGVSKHLQEAQTAAQKKDFAAAATAIAAAKAVENRTPFDDYTFARIAIAVDANNNDMPGATAAAQAAADSPAQPEADKVGNYNNALMVSLYSKQYDKAEQYAKLLDATNPTDPKQLESISNAYYYSNDFANAKVSAQKRIDVATKAGKVPDRTALQILVSANVGLKDEAGAESSLEMLVAAYNDPNDWAQIIDVTFGTKGLRDVDAIWLGRLLFLTGAPVSPGNATIVGSTAGHLAFFGDAQNAKTHGGTVDPDPGPRAEADKKTLPAQIAAEQKQNGVYSAKLAEALYGYGMYPESEAAAQTALTKGGNPDASEAPMVLGQAQAAQGKYDAALASFGQVTGGGPATPRITKLWIDYVNIKKAPPAAAPASAPAPTAAAH